MGYDCGDSTFAAAVKMEENAVQEAASAGMQSIGEFIKLLSRSSQDPAEQHGQYQKHSSSSSNLQPDKEIKVAAEVAVNNFKKVISLLGRPRTGHARFRRAPVLPPKEQNGPSVHSTNHRSKEQVSAFKVYCPTPVHRLPPLPHQINKTSNLATKSDHVPSSINFSASATNSFISSVTAGDTDSVQPSFSSGFQFTTPSACSGKPPLSSSSLKRKCNSMDDAALKCDSSSGRCHCSKKRSV